MNAALSTSAAKRRERHRGLSIAATLTLLATGWVVTQGDDVDGVPQPTRARTASVAVATNSNSIASNAAKHNTAWPTAPLSAPRASWPAVSAQAAAAWNGPSAPKVIAPPAPKSVTAKVNAEPTTPQAPNFPYALIGRIDDGAPQAMLSGPTRSFGVRVNEVIDGQWRVDAVDPQSMSLTWLPGSIKKSISFSVS